MQCFPNPESKNQAVTAYSAPLWECVFIMLRLALILGAAIYAGLVIFSERDPAAPATPVAVSRAAAIDPTSPVAAQRRDSFTTADGRILHITATIDPMALARDDVVIAHVTTQSAAELAETLSVSASAGLPDGPLVEVTGHAVNLRAGPSTGDTVLTALLRGEQAELIETLGNGWVQVRTRPGGTVGYMSDRFIAPLD